MNKLFEKISYTIKQLKVKAKHLKKELRVIYIACKRPDIPWYTKIIALLVVGYALSPIDLIPDFIPVLGYLDDIIIVPLGIWVIIRLIPKHIVEDCREHADEVFKEDKPKNWIAGAFIIGVWIIILVYLLYK